MMNLHPPWLSQIIFSKINISLEAKEPVRFTAFTENTIRGWLGPALMRVEFCSFLNQKPCPPCISPSSCTYHYFFEGKTSNATKPFIIEVLKPRDKWDLKPGEALELQITLIGEGTQHQDKLAVAFMKFNNEVRIFQSTFRLVGIKSATAEGTLADYQVGSRRLISLEEISAGERFAALRGAKAVCIRYRTPTALLQEGRFVKGAGEMTFELVIRRLLRRNFQLATDHCGYRDGRSDVEDLISASREVELVESELRWREYGRYSRRQEEEQAFGGYVGLQIFKGDFDRFAPLLALGECLHVGKRATFGFGKVEIEPLAGAR